MKTATLVRLVVVFFFLLPPSSLFAATMGYDQIGNTSTTLAFSTVAGNVFTATENFRGENIHYYLIEAEWPDDYSAVAVYDVDGSNNPLNLLGQSDRYTDGWTGWNTVPLLTPVNIYAGQDYYVCVQFDLAWSALSRNTLISRPRFHDTSNTFHDFSDPSQAVQLSSSTYTIYLSGPLFTPTPTITLSSTPSPTITHTPTRTLTPTQSLTRTRTPTVTLTPVISSTATITSTITSTSTMTPTPTITRTLTISPTVTISPTITETATPVSFTLDRHSVIVYPQPATKNDLWFAYTLSGPGQVSITVYTILGEKGAVLTNTHTGGGLQRTHWDISRVAQGVYIYKTRIQDDLGSRTAGPNKLIIVK